MNFTYAVVMYSITCPSEETTMGAFSTLVEAEAFIQKERPNYSDKIRFYIETL